MTDWRPRLVHHLVTATEWAARDSHAGTYQPASLVHEGFIHFSTTAQVPATSLRYHADADALLCVTVDVTRLGADLRWEDLVGNGEFPHLYGPLNLDAVVDVRPYTPGAPVDAA